MAKDRRREFARYMRKRDLELRAIELEERERWRDESADPLAEELRRANPKALPGWLSPRVTGRYPVPGWWVRTVERGKKSGKYVVWYKVFKEGRRMWRKTTIIPDRFRTL